MKKVQVLLATLAVMVFTLSVSAASLTNIYDFSNLNPLETVFEGIDFDAQGNLWITSAPNNAANTLLQVDLENESLLNIFDASSMFNPVGLAIDGDDMVISNIGLGAFDVSVEDGAVVSNGNVIADPTSAWMFNLFGCPQPEGATYMGDMLYVSCENGSVFEINPLNGAYSEVYNTGKGALGLGATDDGRLIIGGYNEDDAMDRSLILYSLSDGSEEVIDLNDLFVGDGSDYANLTGNTYGMEIVDNSDWRNIPDPDGLAFRDGKIYMTFEHDLRVFEISLTSVPEPGTVLLLGAGLLALVGLRRKRQ